MSLSVGIVGLPNVGKSTLFKALTKKQVDIANYPFCTIEPNTGYAEVKDERLFALAEKFNSKKTVPAVVKFVDIAGLVKGASRGEGLGNRFLSHIKEADAIIHTVRVFHNPEITDTGNRFNPPYDIDVINAELALKDLEQIEKQIAEREKEARAGKKDAARESQILAELKNLLDKGGVISEYLEKNKNKMGDNEILFIKQSQFLTAKPVIYVLNYIKKEETEQLRDILEKRGAKSVCLNIKEELEFSELSEQEKKELNFKEPALPLLVKISYEILGLITFFTTGEDETRGWTVHGGTKAPEAAGKIHSDFEKKFIRAEVINWEKLLLCGSYSAAKEKGLLRLEGKDYTVQDGDVMEIKHGT